MISDEYLKRIGSRIQKDEEIRTIGQGINTLLINQLRCQASTQRDTYKLDI